MIIPTYNRAGSLCRAIESVIQQTHPALEIIVVDDGSTDNTVDLVKKYPNVRYYYQVNQGVSSARNRGAEEAIGDWLIFLDSDDELLLRASEEFAKCINQDPEKLVFTGGFLIRDSEIEKEFIPIKGKYIGNVSGSFTILRNLFLELGGYDSRLKFAENTELFFRIEWAGYLPGLVPIPMMCYYENPNGGSKNLKNKTDSILLILEKHKNSLPASIKRLYNQILGVNFLRFKDFSLARKHLLVAYKLDFKRLDTLGRYLISCLPLLAKKLYPENPR